jgi:hypothetical protein
VDAEARERFLTGPRGEAHRAGLTAAEGDALAGIDRAGLALASRSFERKHARFVSHRRGWRERLSALLDRLSH